MALFLLSVVLTGSLTLAKDLGCCSWAPNDHCTTCDRSSNICSSDKNYCQFNCGGLWCPDGPNGTGYNTPSICEARAGETAAYACLDWNIGSAAMVAAAKAANMEETHFFGVADFYQEYFKTSNTGKCWEVVFEVPMRKLLFQQVGAAGEVLRLHMGDGGGHEDAGCVTPTNNGGMSMYAGKPSQWGTNAGGWRSKADCSLLPSQPRDGHLPAGEPNLNRLCELGFEYGVRLEGGGHPGIASVTRVACPASLVDLTGLDRTDFAPETHRYPVKMFGKMDCCKASIEQQSVSPTHPRIKSCKADGYTRIEN